MVGLESQPFRVIEGGGGSTAQDESPMETVGAFLREAREHTGRSVADVALSLRIHPKFIEAIEDSRYQDLPGPTYAVGFVRTYADYLALDIESLVGQFKAESRGADGQPDLEFLAPATVGWFPTGKVVAICALLAVAVFGGWFYLQNEGAVDVAAIPIPPGFTSAVEVTAVDEKPAAVQIVAAPVAGGSDALPTTDEQAATGEPDTVPVTAPVLPDPAATLEDQQQPILTEATGDEGAEISVSAPVPATASPDTTQAAPAEVIEVIEPLASVETESPQVAATVAETPPPTAPAPVAETPVVAAPPPLPPAPIATTTATQIASLPNIPAEGGQTDASGASGNGRTYGVINQEARVIIGAKADSWVQVLDNQQNVVLTRMLRAGDRYLVPNRTDLVMLTGNAGGLVISVDGAPVPKIGSDGAILHNVRLDVELLKAGRAVIQ
jgi:cytoskeleton protein RodZ